MGLRTSLWSPGVAATRIPCPANLLPVTNQKSCPKNSRGWKTTRAGKQSQVSRRVCLFVRTQTLPTLLSVPWIFDLLRLAGVFVLAFLAEGKADPKGIRDPVLPALRVPGNGGRPRSKASAAKPPSPASPLDPEAEDAAKRRGTGPLLLWCF